MRKKRGDTSVSSQKSGDSSVNTTNNNNETEEEFGVFPISEKKTWKCKASKAEWLRCLSYFTKPDFLPPKVKYKRSQKFKKFHMNFYKKFQVLNSCSYIANLLQKSILQRNWSAAVSLLKILLKHNLKKEHLRFLTESIYTVVLNHPSSSPQLIDNFNRSTSMILDCAGRKRKKQDTDEDSDCDEDE